MSTQTQGIAFQALRRCPAPRVLPVAQTREVWVPRLEVVVVEAGNLLTATRWVILGAPCLPHQVVSGVQPPLQVVVEAALVLLNPLRVTQPRHQGAVNLCQQITVTLGAAVVETSLHRHRQAVTGKSRRTAVAGLLLRPSARVTLAVAATPVRHRHHRRVLTKKQRLQAVMVTCRHHLRQLAVGGCKYRPVAAVRVSQGAAVTPAVLHRRRHR
jgi:hypothetical protein